MKIIFVEGCIAMGWIFIIGFIVISIYEWIKEIIGTPEQRESERHLQECYKNYQKDVEKYHGK